MMYRVRLADQTLQKAGCHERLAQARQYIDRNYDRPLVVAQVAQKACLSQFHFIRLFKLRFGLTPHQYLVSCRIAQAKKLLSESNMTVTGICYHVGFESLGSFSTLFHRMAGTSPSAYRQKQRLRRERAKVMPQAAIPDCFLSMLGPIPRFDNPK